MGIMFAQHPWKILLWVSWVETHKGGRSLCFWKSSLMCISDWKFSLWCLHKKIFLQRDLQYPIRCLVFREVEEKKKKKPTDYNRILGPLILLEMHVEKITLNESHWAVHIVGKIYFKDGFNWQAYHYFKKNEKHMKPDIFVELLSVNSYLDIVPVYAQFINCTAIWSKVLTGSSVEIWREGTYEIFWIYKAVSRAFRYSQLLRPRLNSLNPH